MVEFTPFTTMQGVTVFVNSTISRYIIIVLPLKLCKHAWVKK